MAKHLLICSLLLLALRPAAAQKLRGLVRNHEQQPLSAATIALLLPDSSLVATTRSSKTGHFFFDSVAVGNYILQVRYLGYESYFMQVAVPTPPLLHVTLQPLARQLREVQVQGRPPVIEQKIDGLVYNPSADIIGAGSNAQDLLQRVPYVTIGQDGNVSIHGNSVRVFINNKPAEFYTTNVPDLLKQLSAADIARVEVITHPSARYDAEGSSAVLLIWLKRNLLLGFTGTLNANTNNLESGYSLKLNYRLSRLYGGAEIMQNTNKGYNDETSDRQGVNGFHNKQRTENSARGRSNFFTVEGGWEPDSSQSLDIQARLGIFPTKRTQEIEAEQWLHDEPLRAYSRFTRRPGHYRFNTVMASYIKRFAHNREWVLQSGYTGRANRSSYVTEQVEETKTSYREKNESSGSNYDFILQTDYIHPFTAGGKLEAGLKYAGKGVRSNYGFFAFDSLWGYRPDEARSVTYHYSQHVSAAYTSYEHHIGKWKLRAGLRYEYTQLRAQQENVPVPLYPYSTWAPNLLVSHNFSPKVSANLSYTRQIRRPEAYHLTPTADYSDSLNITEGNPELEPELLNHIETGWSFIFKNSNTFNVAIYHDYTNNNIQSTRVMKGNVIYNSYANMAAYSKTGVSLNNMLNIGKGFRLNTNVIYYYTEFRATSSFSFHYLQINNTVTQKLPKGFSLEGNFSWSSPYPFLYGYVGRWFSYYASVNKKLMEDRCSVSLRLINFFHPYVVTSGMFFGDTYSETFTRRFRRPFVQLGIQYKFGKAYQTRSEKTRRSLEGL